MRSARSKDVMMGREAPVVVVHPSAPLDVGGSPDGVEAGVLHQGG